LPTAANADEDEQGAAVPKPIGTKFLTFTILFRTCFCL